MTTVYTRNFVNKEKKEYNKVTPDELEYLQSETNPNDNQFRKIIGSDTYYLTDKYSYDYEDSNTRKLIDTDELTDAIAKAGNLANETINSARNATYYETINNSDRRASLLVAPKLGLAKPSLFQEKLDYVFGRSEVESPSGVGNSHKFKNFVRSQLGDFGGIVFPYTPKINMSYNVNYETTEIVHSNMAFNSYKNSPPPKFSVGVKFTADTLEHAKYMLACIWFLQAISKCDVGTGKSYFDPTGSKSGGGMPPPVLYFSAYNNLMDNIPVVLTSMSFQYPDDKDYIRVVIDTSTENDLEELSKISVDIQDEDLVTKNLSNGNTSISENRFTTYNISSLANIDWEYFEDTILNFWLPIEFTLDLSFLIQPNIARENNIFNLEAYKLGLLKNSKISSAFTQTGSIAEKGTFKTVDNTADSYTGKYMPTGWSW